MAESFTIHLNTEHKIWTSAGGEKACFLIRSLANGGPARARFRRTRAGGKKDLDVHIGKKCWKSKFPVYVLYAAPIDEHIVVTRLDPPGHGIPGTGGGGSGIRPTSDDIEKFTLSIDEVEALIGDDGEEPEGDEMP